MKKSTSMGMNRTGIEASPRSSKEMIASAREGAPTTEGGADDLLRFRAELSKDMGPIGTMPPPSSIKGAASAGMKALRGERLNVLLDKLGERLAFERTGTRLYEGLIAKRRMERGWDGGPSEQDLVRIRNDELRHFGLLQRTMADMGADPTAVTPSADVAAVASQGILQVVSDGRTSLAEALHAIFIAELADEQSWDMLIQLARDMGQEEMARQFQVAHEDEMTHVRDVRRWLEAWVQSEAGTA